MQGPNKRKSLDLNGANGIPPSLVLDDKNGRQLSYPVRPSDTRGNPPAKRQRTVDAARNCAERAASAATAACQLADAEAHKLAVAKIDPTEYPALTGRHRAATARAQNGDTDKLAKAQAVSAVRAVDAAAKAAREAAEAAAEAAAETATAILN